MKLIFLHTGQHYDAALNESFFEQLNIRHPDINLNVCSGIPPSKRAKR
jgi:UDP-N-acetylglucosamine 2-epimerase (non-hydrolysing)